MAERNKNAQLLDIIGQLSNVSDITTTRAKGISKKDIEVQLSCGKKVRVTLWRHLAHEVEEMIRSFDGSVRVLIMTSLNPKGHEGALNLNTSSATRVYCNPDFTEVKEFIKSNPQAEVGIIRRPKQPINVGKINLNMHHISYIKGFVSKNSPQNCDIFCRATIVDIFEDNGWSYVSCSKCMKKLIKSETTLVCEKCDTRDAISIIRYRVEVIVADKTGKASFTLFDRDVFKLLKVSAAQLMEDVISSGQNDSFIIPERMKVVGKSFIFQLRITPFNFTHGKNVFTVGKIIDLLEVDQADETDKDKVTGKTNIEDDSEPETPFTTKKKINWRKMECTIC